MINITSRGTAHTAQQESESPEGEMAGWCSVLKKKEKTMVNKGIKFELIQTTKQRIFTPRDLITESTTVATSSFSECLNG